MSRPTCSHIAIAVLLAGCGLSPTSGIATPAAPPVTSPSPIPPTLSPTTTPTPTLLPTPTEAPLPVEVIEFYHLRIVLTSTSNWAEICLGGASRILASTVTALDGNPGTARLSYVSDDLVMHLDRTEDQIMVQSPQQIGMTVDIALAPGNLDTPLPIRVDKGGWFSTDIRVLLLPQNQPQLLLRAIHQLDEHARFFLDLSSLAASPTSRAEVQRPAPPKMLWAVFYPWIGWDLDAPCTDRPLVGYDIDDPDVLSAHVRDAQQAGIDGFLVSWMDDPQLNRRLLMLLDAAQETGFKIAIYLENTPDPTDRRMLPGQVQDWLDTALSRFGTHPGYMRLGGRPVVFINDTLAAPLNIWQEMFDSLAARGLAGSYFASDFDLDSLGVFDGVYRYGVLGVPDLAVIYGEGSRARYSPLLSGNPRAGIWVAPVQPGGDNCPYLTTDAAPYIGEHSVVDRADGAYYRATFEAAIAADPDWIMITSWNEFGENTHIAPSVRYGDEYLRITAEFAHQWRGSHPGYG
jgi:hypothetical protein